MAGIHPAPQLEHELISPELDPSAPFDPRLVVGLRGPSDLHRPAGGVAVAPGTAVPVAETHRRDLAIVPTHPDRFGGLGFIEKLPAAFSLFAFAVSAMLASRLAHDVVYHGVHVQPAAQVGVFLVVLVMLCLAPLTVFVPKLAAAKRRALLEYGGLVGRHGRLVRGPWILAEPVDKHPSFRRRRSAPWPIR